MKRNSVLALAILFSIALLMISSLALAQGTSSDWTMFRGDPSHSGYSTSTAPSATPTLWSYDTGSYVRSSPAVANGRVFVGSEDKSFYALDATTGAKLWSYYTGSTTGGVGGVSSSPAVVGDVVYVGSDGPGDNVFAFDAASGTKLWGYHIAGGTYTGSPVVVDNKLYIGSPNCNLYAIDASTGAELWTYTTGGAVTSCPAVVNGVVYVGSGDYNVYAIDATTGTKIWSFQTGSYVYSSPTVVDGVVYVGSCDFKVYALNATNGELKWSYNTAYPVQCSPAVVNGKVYIGSDNHYFNALDAATGDQLWSFPTGGDVNSSPAAANGIVYFGSDDGYVYGLNADTGEMLWSYKTGGAVNSSPAFANGVVYVGSDDTHVYAINAGTWVMEHFTVNSEHGSPTPVSGDIGQGTVVTESVASIVDGDAGVRYVCTGWTGTGSVPASGTGTSVTFILMQDSSITWSWKTQYYFTVTSPYASVGGAGWYDSGSPTHATLTSTGVTGVGYVFTNWGTDVSGTNYSASSEITMNEPKTATANWVQCNPAVWIQPMYSTSVRNSPAVANGIVYVGVHYSLYALDASTGAQKWSYNTGMTSGAVGGVFSSPTVTGGVVYCGSDGPSKNVYALNAVTGAEIWTYEIPGGVGYSSPAVTNGLLYIGSPNCKIYALDAATGISIWNYTTGAAVTSSPTVVNGIVYVGSEDHNVYALDAATGALKWSYTTGNQIDFSSPTVVNGVLYIGSGDGKVYALDAATGAFKWSYTTGGLVQSSPTVANGVVYVGSGDANLYALNAATGVKIWSQVTGYVRSSPAVANGVVYVSSLNRNIYAFDASTGTTLWCYATGDGVRSSPVVVNGVVYVGSDDGKVYAIKAGTWRPHLAVTSVYGSPTPVGGDFCQGTVVTESVTSPVAGSAGVQYVCTGWTGTGSVPSSGTGTSVTFKLTQDSTITWIWKTQYQLTVSSAHDTPAGAGWYDSGSTARAHLSSGTVSAGSGSQYVFIGWGTDASGTNYASSNAITMNGPKTATANWINCNPTLWTYQTGRSVESSPTLSGGVVYVGSDDCNIYALNALTGAKIWNYPTGDWVHSSPTVADGVVYVASEDNSVYALDAGTGTLVWSFKTGSPIYSSPTVADGVVYVGSGDGKVYALNATTGALKWSYQTGSYVESSPVVVNGVVYVGSDDGKVYSLDATTGAFKWFYTTGAAVASSPTVVNGVVYVGSNDHNVYALNAATGSKLWSYLTSDWVYSSPTVANGIVYVGSDDGNIYALNTATGARIWSFPTGSYVESSPTVADGIVYIGSDDCNLYALDALTGAKIWTYPTDHWIVSSPLVANGVVYIGANDGNVYAIRAGSWATQQSHLTVTSAYGSPNPSTGSLDQGTIVTASVASPVAGSAGVQYVCTGWTGTGSVPSSGTGTSVTFTITQDSTITWNWKTQYQVTFAASPSIDGSTIPSGPGAWEDAGPLSISASANSGYAFSSWSSNTGSITFNNANSASTMATISGPGTITANFAASRVTEKVTITPANGYGSSDSVTVSGADASVSSIPMDGLQHTFTADASSTITFTVQPDGTNSRYRFNNAGTASTTWSYTTSASDTDTKSNTIYFQLLDTFQYSIADSPADSPPTGPTITFNQLGLSKSSDTAALYPSTVSTNWVDYNSSPTAITYTNPLSTSTSTERWQATSTPTYMATSSTTFNPSYYHQWKATFTVSGLDSDLNVNDDVLGVFGTDSYTLYKYGDFSGNSLTVWVNSGSVYSWTEYLSVGDGTSERFVLQSSSDSSYVTAAGTFTASYQKQWQVTFTQNGISGDTTSTVVTVNGDAKMAAQLPFSAWYDNGATITYSFTSPVSAGSGKQYVLTTPAPTPSSPIAVGSSLVVTGTYKTQYQVTFSASPTNAGTTNPAGTNVWEDADSLSISATPNTGYSFDHWSTTDSISFASSTSPSTTATISGPGTLTANFIDNTKPVSSVGSLPIYETSSTFNIPYTASDQGSGVNYVELFYSKDGGSWTKYGSTYTSSPISFTGLGDGIYGFYTVATDNWGNVEDTPVLADTVVTLDTTAPLGSITSPSDGAITNSGNFAVSGLASDAASGVQKVEISVDGGSYSAVTSGTTSWSYNALGLADGSHTFKIKVTDNAGWTYESFQNSVTLDTVAPSTTGDLTGTKGLNDWYISNVGVSLTSTDATSGVKAIHYILDNEAEVVVIGGSASFTISTDGVHTLEYWAVDNAGNIETHSTQTIMVDKTAPTGGVLTANRSPDSNGWYNHDVTWTASGASDATSGGVTYGDPVVYSGPDSSTASVSILVTDAAGNSAILTQTFKYDATTPTLSTTLAGTLQVNGWYTTSVTVTLTSGDAVSGVASVEYNLNGAGWTTYTGPFVITTEGSNTLQYRVTDKAGNTNILTGQAVNIDDSEPTITITNPANGVYLDVGAVTVSGISADGAGVSKVEVKVDSGSYSLAKETTSWSFNTASLSPGLHTVTARVTDLGGNTAETSVNVHIGATSLTYSGASSGQYSDPVAVSATLIDLATGNGISGKTISFTIGSQTETAITNSLGVASTTLTLTQASGNSYTVHASFAGGSSYQASSDSDPFTINKEIAAITYTGDTFTSTDGASTITVTLSASVVQQADGSLGDLTLAKVTFELFKSSNLGSNPDVVVSGVSVDSSGIATTTTDLPTDVWTVKVCIDTSNGYWTQSSADFEVLTVTTSTTSSITGGGWIVDSGSVNNKGNFGFNVQYNKHQDPKGNFVYIYRGLDGYDYIVKSNSWQGGGLSFTGVNSAVFSGKCVIQRVNPLTGEIASAGNSWYSVSIVDGNLADPVVADTLGLSFSGAFTSSDSLTRTITQIALGGGNIAVHNPTAKSEISTSFYINFAIANEVIAINLAILASLIIIGRKQARLFNASWKSWLANFAHLK